MFSKETAATPYIRGVPGISLNNVSSCHLNQRTEKEKTVFGVVFWCCGCLAMGEVVRDQSEVTVPRGGQR